MKKFGNSDIIYNSIRTYPKVRFFVNSGVINVNNDADSSGNAVLFDFLRNVSPTSVEECFLLAETGEPLLTEILENISPESCLSGSLQDCQLLTQDNNNLVTQNNDILVSQQC